MKVLHKSIAFLLLAFFTAVADPSEVDYTKTSIYVHPVALLFGANINALLFYSTIEIPLSLYNAPIIKPSVWKNESIFRVGSDIGIRHYLAGRGEGMYLQPQVGAFYFYAKDISESPADRFNDDANDKHKKVRGPWFDGMLYWGNTYKFAYISIYSDTGIGYGYISGSRSLIYDANIALGISF